MIDGVVITNLTTHSDERGFFREIVRFDDAFFPVRQASHAFRVSGQCNGWHIHHEHSEAFYVSRGLIRLCLKDCRCYPDGVCVSYPYDDKYDLSENFGLSKTPDEYMEIVLGDSDPKMVIVPSGVAHGYRVMADTDLYYFATKTYETSRHDEGRIEWNRWPQHRWTRRIETK